jgi:hypothetical protein
MRAVEEGSLRPSVVGEGRTRAVLEESYYSRIGGYLKA